VAAAVQRLARVVDVHTGQCGGEVVGIALPADLAVGDDVQPSAFLLPNRDQCGIVLRLVKVFIGEAPQLPSPDPRGKPPRQPLAVDQPVGLSEATH
jgi:hypothetical protein